MVNQRVQQVRVVNPMTQQDQVADVAVADGKVSAIAPQLTTPAQADAVELIAGQGKVLLPGLIDLYSHSGEPGYESRETLGSLLQAGLAGGFSRIGILPTTQPAVDTPAQVNDLRARRQALTAQPNLPQILLWGAITQGAAGSQLSELAELAAAGVVGFTDRPLQNPLLLRRLLEYAQPLARPVGLWPCDRGLVGQGVAREGSHSLIYGLPGDPALSEAAALAVLIECVAATGTAVHIMRLSTARGVALVRQAKASGLPITASTTWMHLLLSTADLASYDPTLRLAPPLGTPADQAALIEAVSEGSIDAIAIDHRPYTYEEKTVGFAAAPPGAIGLELALPLLWQRFVATGQWSALTLAQRLSSGPATCLNLTPPNLAPGQPAEMLLFDPEAVWQVTPQTLRSRSCNTPWLGQQIKGQVLQLWVN